MAGLDEASKAETYRNILSLPTQEQLDAAVAQASAGQTREAMEETMVQAIVQQTGMSQEEITEYTAAMSDEELEELFAQAVQEQFKAQYAAQVEQQLAGQPDAQLAAALDLAMESYTAEQWRVLLRPGAGVLRLHLRGEPCWPWGAWTWTTRPPSACTPPPSRTKRPSRTPSPGITRPGTSWSRSPTPTTWV